ncbi:MAG: putative Fe-S cluster protein YjdI [Cyclobacteriaceae bacterium]|jgi:uncharacterized Fe-S cluster protein YjdI
MKTYQKENVKITWEPDKCIHSAVCVKGLSSVFKPNEKPWINVDGATKDEIVSQVNQCPSGALGLKYDE